MRMAYYRPPMTERTLLHALEQVRRECIYGADGVEHVDALLRLRGVDPDSLYVPRKMPSNRFSNRELKRMVLNALKERPRTSRQIGEYIYALHPHIDLEACVSRARGALYRIRRQSLVVREKGVWRLAL